MKEIKKRPSVGTIIVTGWLGFMFATALAALIPSLQLLASPIVCSAPYSHGVVDVHNFSYTLGGSYTSGYSSELRCADLSNHEEQGTSIVAVLGLLWLYGWAGALAIRGLYYWAKVGLIGGREAWWRRKLPASAAEHHSAFGTAETAEAMQGAEALSTHSSPAPPHVPSVSVRAPARPGPAASTGGRAVLANGRWVVAPRGPDPVEQLAKLADLHDRGALTDAEFAMEKAKILNES